MNINMNKETYESYADRTYKSMLALWNILEESDSYDDKMSYADNITHMGAQTIERYLKHIIDMNFLPNTQEEYLYKKDLLHTHKIKRLLNLLNELYPDYQSDWNELKECDGYYFETAYPGDNANPGDIEDAKMFIEKCELARYLIYVLVK